MIYDVAEIFKPPGFLFLIDNSKKISWRGHKLTSPRSKN